MKTVSTRRAPMMAKCLLGIALSATLTGTVGVTSATAATARENIAPPEGAGVVAITNDVDEASVITSAEHGNKGEIEAGIRIPGTKTTESVDIVDLPTSVVSAEGPALATHEVDGSIVSAYSTQGGVQTFIQIPDPSSPMEYRFPIDTPNGASLELQPDGSVFVVGSDALPMAVVDVPWALDAEGAQVPTHFRVEGNTIVQVLQPEKNTTFPIIADPDFWWIVAQSAGCLAEVAALSLAAAKVVQAFAKADRIIRAAKALGRYYDALGGRMDLVIGVLKKWINNRAALTRSQMSAIEGLVREGGKIIFNVIGLGTCYSLVTQG